VTDDLGAERALRALDDVDDAVESADDSVGRETDPTDPTDPADPTGPTEATSSSESASLLDALIATQPDPPLDSVESPWNPESGGLARLYRGVGKMLDVDGVPAVFDVVVGFAEHLHHVGAFDDGDGDGDGGDDGLGELGVIDE